MFAAATREVVFSNPEVVRRVNSEFIPVALKAAMVNNPPAGIEGELYAEIGRSKPAPQGICTTNSAGKVLAWALSFDDDKSILGFLDHVAARYRQSPDARGPVPAERFMRFPSRKLASVKDSGRRIRVPDRHADDRCPARPVLQRGTLLGRIIGRALDQDGQPVADTIRQEHYLEARLQISPGTQAQLAQAARRAGKQRFRVPNELAEALVSAAFLGQLDVNPFGGVPGSRNKSRKFEFWGQQVGSIDAGISRFRINGSSNIEGGQDTGGKRGSDGRIWEHHVTLDWYGFIDVKEQRVEQLVMLANGNERLRWGNARLRLTSESDAQHLMAGHPIDLACAVRYGVFAEPCPPEDVVEGAADDGRRARGAPPKTLQAKMQRLQSGLQRLRQARVDPANIARRMRNFAPLMRQQKFREAEALLDESLKLLEQK